MQDKIDILSLLPEELGEIFKNLGEPKYRTEQVFRALHRGVRTFDEMLNLPKALRQKLTDIATINSPIEITRQIAKDETEKILWEFSDKARVESVIMKYNIGNSVCMSSQVGCRMGCKFCATGAYGLERNLTAGEILGQIMKIDVSRIVVMGMGEPLDNYDNTVKFLRLVSHPLGKHISARHISVSTCGLVPQIKKLANENLPISLYISLHAPNDEIRREIMPIAKKYPMDELLDACRYYFERTSRKISYEYILLKGINDSVACARELKKKLYGAHINIIPYNSVDGKDYSAPNRETIENFTRELRGMDVTVRRKMGGDIDAACGQLTAKEVIDCKLGD